MRVCWRVSPPIFERFSPHTRDAINAGIEHARRLSDPYVEPAHLLLGVLDAKAGLAATLRSNGGWKIQPVELVQPRYPQINGRGWTDIFSTDARRIVAEDVLILAERVNHRTLTTGHLLIAILESPDDRTSEIINALPDVREITAAVIDALPGEEDS